MSRIQPLPTIQQRTARALQHLERAEEQMLRHALLALSHAQDAYLRERGAGEPASTPSPRGPRDAEGRLEAAMVEAARWRAIVDERTR